MAKSLVTTRPRIATPVLGHPIVGRLGEARDRQRLALRGTYRVDDAGRLWAELRRETERLGAGERLDLDLAAVDAIDARTAALLVDLRAELAARGVEVELIGARGQVAELIRLYGGDRPAVKRRRRRREGFLERVGRRTLELVGEARAALDFVGKVVIAALGLIRSPRTGNWRQVFPTMERCGADAVPTIVLINFLVGFVVAYQAAAQLHTVGADVYLPALVGKSITREMAPLMTAIVVCGRSGAAFAAELGTMRVGEEIDALRTLGFGPIRYLVLPRVVALVLVMPLLVVLGDLAGVIGGFVGGAAQIDVTPESYARGIHTALVPWDVLSGLIKSAAFAFAIAMIACQQGFAAAGGAEGVGRRTTASVVAILFALILIDTGFTILFQLFGP